MRRCTSPWSACNATRYSSKVAGVMLGAPSGVSRLVTIVR